MSSHFSVNPDVLRAWCDAPSHFITPEQPAAPAEPQQSRDSSPQRHRYTPAEISQQSVDLCLREYYKLVTSQQRYRSMYSSEGPETGLLQRMFLLACPTPPACLELDQVFKAAVKGVQLVARGVALSACLLVPVLLGVIRQVQAQQGPTAAAAVAVGGLLLLLACDRISRAAVKQQAAAQATCVTAATLQQRLETGNPHDPSHELATLRAVSKTATTSNSSRPNSISHQHAAHTARQQQQQHLSGPAAANTGSGSGAATSYAALEPDLAALQTALGVKVGSSHAAGSKEHVVEVLGQLCAQYGVAVTPDMMASTQAAAATVAQLKRSIGI